MAWAYEQQNLGAHLFENFGYEGVFVIGPDGDTTYAVLHGRLTRTPAERWLQGDLAALLAHAREPGQRDQAVGALLRVGDEPALVSAGVIGVGGSPLVEAAPGPASVLLFVDLVEDATFERLGASLGLAHLYADRPGAVAGTLSQPLTADGSLVLRWDAPRDGQALLETVLPLFAVVAVVLGVLKLLVLRNAAASVRGMQSSEARFRDIAEFTTDWLWEADAEDRISFLSSRFAQVTGQPPELWLGQPLDALMTPVEGSLHEWLLKVRQQGLREPLVCRYYAADGHERLCRVLARPICNAQENPGGLRGAANDITDEVAAQSHIEHLARHDPLTGLANRRQLEEFLEALAHDRRRPDHPYAVICIDLDRFKPVNDALGHAAGDVVLCEVARRLRQHSRDADLVARTGGDEFVMVLLGITDQAALSSICSRLIESLDESIPVAGQEVFIGASLGIACFPDDSRSADDLLRFADLALYQAKAAGRNTWRFYAREMNERVAARRQLEQELRQAVRGDELRLHFQPRFQVAGMRLAGVEALVRWQHPRRGLIGPDEFIPLAEETGLRSEERRVGKEC